MTHENYNVLTTLFVIRYFLFEKYAFNGLLKPKDYCHTKGLSLPNDGLRCEALNHITNLL